MACAAFAAGGLARVSQRYGQSAVKARRAEPIHSAASAHAAAHAHRGQQLLHGIAEAAAEARLELQALAAAIAAVVAVLEKLLENVGGLLGLLVTARGGKLAQGRLGRRLGARAGHVARDR